MGYVSFREGNQGTSPVFCTIPIKAGSLQSIPPNGRPHGFGPGRGKPNVPRLSPLSRAPHDVTPSSWGWRFDGFSYSSGRFKQLILLHGTRPIFSLDFCLRIYGKYRKIFHTWSIWVMLSCCIWSILSRQFFWHWKSYLTNGFHVGTHPIIRKSEWSLYSLGWSLGGSECSPAASVAPTYTPVN